MKWLSSLKLRTIIHVCVLVSLVGLVTGCEEANLAVDNILGKQKTVMATAPESPPQTVIPAKKRSPGELSPVVAPEVTPAKPGPTPEPPAAPTAAPSGQTPAQPKAPEPAVKETVPPRPAPTETARPAVPKVTPPLVVLPGKRRAPGVVVPVVPPGVAVEEPHPKETFFMVRNPFRQPTEILPSECPPSMPLCRFDYSQIKLVGVIQITDGNYKGMVEDPDGRGYFITAGTQVGGATVTQVSNKGITLRVHRTHQDKIIPLFREAKEGGEF
jgi:hypothetical protein